MEYHRFRSTQPQCSFKVAVVGCGNVGATTAYALLLGGTPTNLSLIDLDAKRAESFLLDLEHSLPFTSSTCLEAGTKYALCKDAQVIVITAGAHQKPGQTRLDLLATNRKIIQNMIPQIIAVAPNAIIVMVTNPVDILTYEAAALSKLPWGRVFGTGTMLDSARFRFHISEKLKINPESIDAYVLGEHGNSSFPVYSSSNIFGLPLVKYPGFTEKMTLQCYEETKNAAYKIIAGQGFTCYSIATVVQKIVHYIFEDAHVVCTLSVPLRGEYGQKKVAISVPCVLGRHGVEKIIAVPLSKKEQKQLTNSVNTLKALL